MNKKAMPVVIKVAGVIGKALLHLALFVIWVVSSALIAVLKEFTAAIHRYLFDKNQ
jgi:hypothetical protein